MWLEVLLPFGIRFFFHFVHLVAHFLIQLFYKSGTKAQDAVCWTVGVSSLLLSDEHDIGIGFPHFTRVVTEQTISRKNNGLCGMGANFLHMYQDRKKLF